MTNKNYLAVDLGATSGRTIVATYDGSKVEMRELTRFKNPMIPLGGHLFWDLPALYNEIVGALKKVADEQIPIESVGIDTWGCDFAFFGADGQLLGLPYCYRDPHTEGAIDRYMKMHDKRAVYESTGIQFMEFNSIFHLDTLRHNGCTALENADKILFIPDALIYMLTGKAICEYTVASTSQLLNPRTGDLDEELLRSIGLKRSQFGEMTQPGTVIGPLTPQLQEATGLKDVNIIAIAAHDTASAVASVPAKDADFAYLSCGTWSLMGIESPVPIITDESFRQNFTNEGGIDGTTRFLKNICGLWLLEQSRICPEFKDAPKDIVALSALCETTDFDSIINPDDPSFAHPASMTKAIRDYCIKTGQSEPKTPAEYVRCIFLSLAHRYKAIIEILESMSPVKIKCLHVIGGGSLNRYLMQYTADAIGRPVICGPTEGTALGNVLLQIKAQGMVKTLPEMRKIVSCSTELKEYLPKQ
ncbi:MAG: rhamnulokinase [Bacteroidales bacterium]|nr:rhamnulokinase [Bacteroidales bacterium]